MKLRFGTLTLLAIAIATVSAVGAQSVHHDKMDARAAKMDIRRLRADRKMAVRTKNWGKVAQDDRLIAADKHFVHKDVRKVDRAGG